MDNNDALGVTIMKRSRGAGSAGRGQFGATAHSTCGGGLLARSVRQYPNGRNPTLSTCEVNE